MSVTTMFSLLLKLLKSYYTSFMYILLNLHTLHMVFSVSTFTVVVLSIFVHKRSRLKGGLKICVVQSSVEY